MKFHRKTLQIFFFFLLIANLAWNVYLYFLPNHTTIWNYLYNAAYGMLYLIGGGIAIVYGFIFGLKSNLGKMLLFLGFGLWCYEFGLIIWVYYNLVLKVSIPFPSLADIFFVLFYPVMAIGCFYLVRLYGSLLNKGVLRDSIIIMVVSLLAVFFFFERPDLSAHLSLAEKIINVLYPGGDAILMAMALIALRIGGGKIHPSLYIFSFGLVLQAAADFLFVYRTAQGTYWNGDIADLLYTLSGYVTSIGLFEVINSLNHVDSNPNPNPVESTNTLQPEIPTHPPITSPTPIVPPSTESIETPHDETSSIPTEQPTTSETPIQPASSSQEPTTPQEPPASPE